MIPKELEHLRPIVQVYLEQIPAVARQSLIRPEDRTGRSVPAGFRLDSADELANILPKAWSRFKAGDPLPGRPGWVLDRYLGSGGFGEVWLAFQTNSPSVSRAIKFCGSGENARLTLIRESNVLKRIMKESSHRGIVPLLDMNLDGDMPWLAYEYVEGGTLTDAIKSWKKRTIEERQKRAVSALLQLLDVVGYFHGLQPPVVHRDLKPDNILYQLDAKRLRVTDFGIGGIAAAEQIKDNEIGSLSKGAQLPISLHGSHTALYASPQQKEGRLPDPRDDVHALGVILYQMLTGHLDQAPGPDLELRTLGVVEPLIELIAKCTMKDVGLRLKDARDIAARLKDAIDVNRDGLIQRSEIENFVANQREKQTREQTPADRMPHIPGYQMLQVLARSGEGHYYLASHESPGERRLIKYGLLDNSDVLEPQMRILEGLDHPRLVRYRDHRKGSEKGSGDNRYWIVMDYVGEDNLADRLRAGAIATGQALALAEQILQGLAYLHNMQIIHRNLQPQTVIIDKDQPCRLIEFGLAKGFRTDGKQTMSPGMPSDLPSTLRYMSPEQIRESGKLTFSTDIWSFGVILYELLVGKPLFGASIMTLGNEILTKRLILDDNAIPVEMQPLLKRCVERDASYRHANAQIVLEEFREAADTFRRRQRHEHFLPIWLAVFEKRLLERFVAGYSGQFDGTTVQKFMEFAKENGISQLDKEALASVLPPALDAQRAADTAGGELEREKARLEKDLKNLSGAQMHERSDAIEQLEKKHADALKGVSVEIRRQLANEVKEWNRVQAERAEREGREREKEIERSKQLEAEHAERESRELEEWDRVQAEHFERESQERAKKLERSRQLEAERIEREKQNEKILWFRLELAAYASPVALGLFFALLGKALGGERGTNSAGTGLTIGVLLSAAGAIWILIMAIEVLQAKNLKAMSMGIEVLARLIPTWS